MEQGKGNITGLLRAFQGGDKGALEQLLPLVYDELRKIARWQVQGNSRSPVQPTELVHEVFLKIRSAEGLEFADRSHFFAVACQSMRWILADLAKGQTRDKRGGACVKVSFEETRHGSAVEVDAGQLNNLFQAFEAQDPRAARVAQLKILMGLEVAEIATVMAVSAATVKRDWQLARSWILRELGFSEAPKGKNAAR